MAHTYASQLMHCVFSTKERRSLITTELQERLWPYLSGIARDNKMKTLSVGGVQDHIHILLSLPTTLSISKAMQLLKGGSSKWIHDTFPEHRLFSWQEGYGAFSIGVSDVDRTVAYIETQATHHQKRDFKAEYLGFLKKHSIEYDERYIWS
ncbi:MAG: IS200/IS605 family transposase [Blastocatellia bacterium]